MISGSLVVAVLPDDWPYIILTIGSYLCKHSSHFSYSSSISCSPFSILFLSSNVCTTGTSLIPDVIRPRAILSELLVLSNAKSLIYSPRYLNSSIPVLCNSLVKTCVAETDI
jgi:hypothetical protein